MPKAPTSPSANEAEAATNQRVIPQLRSMPAKPLMPPESAIGDRIANARRQLGLSVEALARYTKHFDEPEKKGISAASLLRYESANSEPGARELRILCDALAIPPKWLIYGELDNAGEDSVEQGLLQALENYVLARAKELRTDSGMPLRKMFATRPSTDQRARWLDEAKGGSRPK